MQNNTIGAQISALKATLPKGVQLVAVSKTKPMSDIQQAYAVGQRVFGENKVQELVEKYANLPKDIEWHFIGHLQSNKVKYIAPFVHLIHAVDSLKLLKEINKQAIKHNRIINCLLQFHIAEENSKFGLAKEDISAFMPSVEAEHLTNVRIRGVMGMATFTSDTDLVRNEFKALGVIFETLKTQFFAHDDAFKDISMGMSGDYELAIEQGSSMVRLGSTIFGAR